MSDNIPDGSETRKLSSLPEATGPDGAYVGPYRLLQKLGEGGMGEVWEAEQTEPLRRTVALKLVKWGMDTRQVVARFEAERQALALMDHPNVARVFDAGATERGRPYFVMELVRGESITRYCDRHRLTTGERLELFSQVCEGVQHAHQKGIIHRDLKPSNVLVETRNGKRVPKIIDFGVAKAVQQRLTERTVFTEMGQLIGTPEYMSPEQAEMTVEDVDTRTDVYSLGVLLYELLVGALPFDSKSLRQAGFDEIRRRIREEEPLKPSTRLTTMGAASAKSAEKRRTDLRGLKRQLSGDLDWIAIKALEKDRVRRYASPNDLAADIGRQRNHEAIVAGPPRKVYRAKKFVRRHRLGVALVAAAAVLLVGFAVRERIQALRIAAERERAADQAEVAQRVSDFLVEIFEVSDPSEVRGNSITAREILDRAAGRIQRLEDRPDVQARLLWSLGLVYRNLGLRKQALPFLERVLEIYSDISGPDHPDSLGAMNNLGILYLNLDRLGEAEELLSRTLEARKRVLGENDRQTLGAAYNLAGVYSAQGRLREAERLYLEVVDALELGNPFALQVRRSLARVYQEQGRFAEAVEESGELLELQRQDPEANQLDILETTKLLALSYRSQGLYDRAVSLFEEAREDLTRVFGPDHPRVLVTSARLGATYHMQGRLAEAETLLLETWQAEKRALGTTHRDSLTTANDLAIVYKKQRRYREAEALYREILEIRRAKLGLEHPATLRSMANLGNLYLAEERYAEAEPLLVEATETHRRQYGDGHAQGLSYAWNLVQLYDRTDRLEIARPYSLRLLEQDRKAAENPDATARDKNNYASTLLTCVPDDLRDAETALKFALEANEMSGFERPDRLENLALAYHRTGDRKRFSHCCLEEFHHASCIRGGGSYPCLT